MEGSDTNRIKVFVDQRSLPWRWSKKKNDWIPTENNDALMDFDGTLIFVSHDRAFVSSLANRVIEIKDNKIIDFQGTYDEYLTHIA